MKTRQTFTALTFALVIVLPFTVTPVIAGKTANVIASAAEQAPAAAQYDYTVDELKEMAEANRKSRNIAALIFALKTRAEMEPSRFDVRLELGSVYMSQNKFAEAIAALMEASAIIPSDEAPHSLLAKIYKHQKIDSLQGYHLVRASQLAQRNWENQYNLAAYLISKGRTQEAAGLLEKTMSLNSAFAPAKFEYAKIMLQNGDLETAFRKFDEAFLLEPQNVNCQAYYAYAANVSGRHTVANNNIEAALKSEPQNTTALYMAGLIHFNNGKNNAAEQSLREAVRYSPTDMLALESLSDVLAANFKYREACANYLKVWHIAGYSERIAFKLSKALACDGRFIEAKDFLEVAAAKSIKNGEMLYKLTEVYCELGDIKSANSVLPRFGGGNAVWHKIAEGRIHEASGDTARAYAAYSAALAMDENCASTNAGLGRLLLKQGNTDNAIAYFNAAITLEPANVQHFINKANAYNEKGNIEEAVAIYESVIVRNPQNPAFYTAVAAMREGKKDLKGAIQSLQEGLAANPQNNDILLALGKLYQSSKQYNLAIGAYQTTVGKKINASTLQALRIIGDIYYKNLDDDKKGKIYYKKYVRAGGKDSDVPDIIKRINNKERTQIALK